MQTISAQRDITYLIQKGISLKKYSTFTVSGSHLKFTVLLANVAVQLGVMLLLRVVLSFQFFFLSKEKKSTQPQYMDSTGSI